MSLKDFLKWASRRGPLRVMKRLFISFTPFFRKTYFAIRWSFRRTEDSNFYYELSAQSRINMAHTLATAFGVNRDTVLSYFAEIEESQVLKNAQERVRSSYSEMLDSDLSPGRRAVWYAVARIRKPTVILETGVHQGLGALCLILALSKNSEEAGVRGLYIGTDLRSDAGVLVKLSELADSFELLVGDSIDSISALGLEVDMYVSDSDHFEGYEKDELQAVSRLLSNEYVIISDNAHATSVLSDWSAAEDGKYVFLDEVADHHWYPGAGVGLAWR